MFHAGATGSLVNSAQQLPPNFKSAQAAVLLVASESVHKSCDRLRFSLFESSAESSGDIIMSACLSPVGSVLSSTDILLCTEVLGTGVLPNAVVTIDVAVLAGAVVISDAIVIPDAVVIPNTVVIPDAVVSAAPVVTWTLVVTGTFVITGGAAPGPVVTGTVVDTGGVAFTGSAAPEALMERPMVR